MSTILTALHAGASCAVPGVAGVAGEREKPDPLVWQRAMDRAGAGAGASSLGATPPAAVERSPLQPLPPISVGYAVAGMRLGPIEAGLERIEDRSPVEAQDVTDEAPGRMKWKASPPSLPMSSILDAHDGSPTGKNDDEASGLARALETFGPAQVVFSQSSKTPAQDGEARSPSPVVAGIKEPLTIAARGESPVIDVQRESTVAVAAAQGAFHPIDIALPMQSTALQQRSTVSVDASGPQSRPLSKPVPAPPDPVIASQPTVRASKTEPATGIAFSRPMPRVAATAAEPPIRIHADWSAQGVAIWIGLDESAQANLQLIAGQVLQWMSAQGHRVGSLVCNGKPLALHRPQSHAAQFTDSQPKEHSSWPSAT